MGTAAVAMAVMSGTGAVAIVVLTLGALLLSGLLCVVALTAVFSRSTVRRRAAASTADRLMKLVPWYRPDVRAEDPAERR